MEQPQIRSLEGDALEWPTIAVLASVYIGFWLGTTVVAEWSLVLAVLVLAWMTAQFSSLQHEVLHGHPFRTRWLNEALVFPGLTLFIPYDRFRDTHLAHHHDEILTDPYEDPESNYQDPAVWARMSGLQKAVLRANNTLLGRMLIGPALSIYRMVADDWQLARFGDVAVQVAWVKHAFGLGLVAAWFWWTAVLPFGLYIVASYLGFGLIKIRTFLEHRAHERASGRTVVVEDRGPLAFLFLNNNFHVVHHMHPKVAWYRLPTLYAQNREKYLTRNGGYRFGSYAEIFRRYFLATKDSVPHPIWRRP